ncbi:hypothetical protein U9323_24885, partial [Escherichia coli]
MFGQFFQLGVDFCDIFVSLFLAFTRVNYRINVYLYTSLIKHQSDIIYILNSYRRWNVFVNVIDSGHDENLLRVWFPGFAPIFPDICYHLTHYKPAAADIPVASDNPAHYADAIRYNAR